jgi:hypothetical protein
MNIFRRAGLVSVVLGVGLFLAFSSAQANLMDEEKEIYVVRPLITEPAWTQTGAYLKSFLFDMPNALARPSAQVGFVFTPGFTWSILDILELNLCLPMVLNPDPTGDRELDLAEIDPSLKERDNWDSHPDFDLPGLLLGLKGRILGKKPEDKVFLAVGVLASISVFEEWSTNFSQWKTQPHQSSPTMISPYVTVGYATGRFSPQLQLGLNVRFHQLVNPDTGLYLRDDNGDVEVKQYNDIFVNLALPIAFPFEGTAPMVEFNFVYNLEDEVAQAFITPAVTFLPKGSPASLGFACMLPILDSSFRKSEGFRFLVNFSYKFDMLSIPGLGDDTASKAKSEVPPYNW